YRGGLQCLPLVGRYSVPEYGHRLQTRKCLLHKLQTLRSEFDLLKEDAGEVAGRSREARHITARQRIIIYGDHHNRLGAAGREGGLEGDFWPAGKENVHVTRGEFLVAAFISLNVWDLHIVEHEILAFFVSQLGHALKEGNINRRRPRLDADQADAQDRGWLLRPRR